MEFDKEFEEKIFNLLGKYYVSQKLEEKSQSFLSELSNNIFVINAVILSSLIILHVMIKYFKFDVETHATKLEEFLFNFAAIVYMRVENFWNFLRSKHNSVDIDKEMNKLDLFELIAKVDQKISKLESHMEDKFSNVVKNINLDIDEEMTKGALFAKIANIDHKITKLESYIKGKF